jgi:uncharacterized protein YbdZ (MbtH family)
MSHPRVWPDPARTVGVWDDPLVDGPRPPALRPERERAPIAARLPTVDDLLRIGLDHAPSLAAEGADRVLGPYALDAPREALREAVALAAFVVPEDDDTSPVDRVLRDLRGPAAEGLRATRWAPLAPWRVRVTGGTAEVTPLLLMGNGAPDGPVAWRALPPCVEDASQDLVFARIANTPGGWRLVAGVAVPAAAAAHVAEAWSDLPEGRPPTTEGTLRSAGHTLLRRTLELHWATTTTRTPTR